MELSLVKIENLKRILEQEEQKKLNEFQGKKALGFALSKGSTKSPTNKRYVVWRAHRYRDRKRVIIHIGADPRKAEERILKFLKSHPELEL